MFEPVETPVRFPQLETKVLQLWRERRIFDKSLAARANAPTFVFYEGPPTANGLPHPGHCLSRAIKDLFPRYKTMRGYRCERKGGWDTHGLPVEAEVCKELGIHAKAEIEQYGVEPFVRRCVESVWRYTREWEQLTERLGFWIRLDQAYVTYHQSYVESVWWALKKLFERGLLYQGHKIVWWWAQGGTALSSGEVGQGYRRVADPSVYVRFPLVGVEGTDWEATDLLVWTTTPWTLPSNQFVAVHPDLDYAVVSVEGQSRGLLLAAALVEEVAAKAKCRLAVEHTVRGEQLVGLRYRPPFDYYYEQRDRRTDTPMGNLTGELISGGRQHMAWRVVPADFVTIDTGTGVVHQAPAFGEVDYDVLLAEQARFVEGEGPPLLCAVAPDGTFTAEAPDYQGRWVKEADGDIVRDMRQRGVLFHQEQYVHEYPFCWRAEEDPLIQYPRRSWFVRTTKFKEAMLANNRRIGWLPEHIRDGRFGNFLETNVDWALSRERFWGTPLPIWVCEQSGYMEAVGSYQELLDKPGLSGTEVWEEAKRREPGLPDDLRVHKPYIDALTYDSPQVPGARMRRVPEVIDCWFDAGAMPFAQWGYPLRPGSRERLADQFPADFISEGLDQTRGWFYSLLAISTLLFGAQPDESPPGERSEEARCAPGEKDRSAADAGRPRNDDTPVVEYPHPFRHCIVLGLILGEDGVKMSKQKRNYREPNEIFDRYGADAMRWYLFSNQPPWTSIRYSEQAIRDCIPEFLLRLWNVYSFFVIYANIDGFDPAGAIRGPAGQLDAEVLSRAEGCRPAAERSELDRWILSELSRTAAAVVEHMDAYDNYAACARLSGLLDALSNWYVRRSRQRFWQSGQSADKLDGYWTLYECLLTTARLIAPFVPFLAETLWQNLAAAGFASRPDEQRPPESVHLCDYPAGDPAAVDEELSRRMALVREITSLGRSARMSAKLKVRQPLRRVEVVLAETDDQSWLADHAGLIAEELNVKQVEFVPQADQYVTYTILPDLKRLGPRLGRRLPAVRRALAEADGAGLLAELDVRGKVTLRLPDGAVELDQEDIQVRLEAKPGWTAAQGRRCVVVLSTELSEELIREGLARELAHAVNTRRKELACDYTERIVLGVVTDSNELRAALKTHRQYIAAETLATQLVTEPLSGVEAAGVRLSGHQAALYVKRKYPTSK